MLKAGSNITKKLNSIKKGSHKTEFVGALASGLNRRAFLRQSSNTILLAGIAACKPNIPNNEITNTEIGVTDNTNKPNHLSETYSFSQHQKKSIVAVQMQLFPEDGDGPSANDINGLKYLEWALTDPDNSEDGDGDFIAKGVGWLDSLSEQTQGDQFIALSATQQDKVLRQISQSSTGENWLSILIYYLMEALLFDPLYGGNPNGIGWKWLQHQSGFPAPTEETNYRVFQ